MERYQVIFKESKVGTGIYKELGKLIAIVKKEGTDELGRDEKGGIKSRCKELASLIK